MNALNSLHTYLNSLEVLLISSICFLFMCRYVLIVVVSSTNGIHSSFLNCGIQKFTILLKLQNTLPEMSKIHVGSPCFKKIIIFHVHSHFISIAKNMNALNSLHTYFNSIEVL